MKPKKYWILFKLIPDPKGHEAPSRRYIGPESDAEDVSTLVGFFSENVLTFSRKSEFKHLLKFGYKAEEVYGR